MKLRLLTCVLLALAPLPALSGSGKTASGETAAEAEAEAGTEMALTGDVEAGEELYQKNCRSCHGPTAKGMASFPKLVGHDAEYLTMRLEQYRAGEKVGANTALMAPNAADLSDQDIADLAAYIVSLE